VIHQQRTRRVAVVLHTQFVWNGCQTSRAPDYPCWQQSGFYNTIQNEFLMSRLVQANKPATGSNQPTSVRLSVFQHVISKTDAARIIKLDTEMFHDESWKPFILGWKGQRSRSQVIQTVLAWVFASCECWLLPAEYELASKCCQINLVKLYSASLHLCWQQVIRINFYQTCKQFSPSADHQS